MRPPSSARRPAVPSLNGFRLLAAAWIFLYHWREPLERLLPAGPGRAPLLAARLLEAGHVSVSALFVLSGFVLAYNYPDPMAAGTRRRFLVARFARIYPGHLLALAIGAPLFLSRLMRGLATPSLADVASYVSLTSAWIPEQVFAVQEPGWATSAVAFFYLAYPPLLAVLAARRPRALLGVAAAAWLAALVTPAVFVALGAADVDSSGWALLVRYDPLLRLPEFALGAAVALWWLRARPILPGLVAPLAVAAWIVLAASPVPRMLLHNGALAPLVAVALVGLAGGRGLLPRVLGWRPVSFLGQAGFGIFILQVPMYWIVEAAERLLGSPPERTGGAFLVTAALTLVAASASLLLLERPAQRAIKAAYERRRAAAPLSEPGAAG